MEGNVKGGTIQRSKTTQLQQDCLKIVKIYKKRFDKAIQKTRKVSKLR